MERIKAFQMFILIILLSAGIFVRCIGLSTHFTHNDDIGVAYSIIWAKNVPKIGEIREKIYDKDKETYNSLKKRIFREIDKKGLLDEFLAFGAPLQQFIVIPLSWTYAPLQFFITPLLLYQQQSYRQVLFWGRLPSCISSVASLFLLWIFFRSFKKNDYFASCILAMSILVFSWENIIYAKHMSSYGLGVFSAFLMIFFIWQDIKNSDYSGFKPVLLRAFTLVLISYSQYQILSFIPAYYLTYWMVSWRRAKDKAVFLRRAVAGLSVYAALMLPVVLFLDRLKQKAVHWWNVGPHREYVLDFSGVNGLAAKALKALFFLVKNFIIVIQSNLSFIPESNKCSLPVACAFFSLFIVGVVSFIVTNDQRKKWLGFFFLFCGLTWVCLLVQGKLTLGPTRHTLILSPFMIIIIAEGWAYIIERLKARAGFIYSSILIAPSIVMAILFFAYFSTAVAERKDPFDEYKIQQILINHKVETVISTDSATLSMDLIMKGLRQYNYYAYSNSVYSRSSWRNKNEPLFFDCIAYVSCKQPVNAKAFGDVSQSINNDSLSLNSLNSTFLDYDIVFREDIDSNVEVDFSRRTSNAPKKLFFYIMRKK